MEKAFKNAGNTAIEATLDKAMERFIDEAPDGKYGNRKLKGKRIAISHTMDPDDLAKLDQAAALLGLKRATFINMVLKKAVKKVLKEEEN